MQLATMTWQQVETLNRQTPVVIPIAAVEQHGHHLPLYTDSFLLEEVVRRADQAVAQSVLFLPLQWLGNSHHHLDFPGTLSADPRVYMDVLASIVENCIVHGFRRILLLNGHGGNIVPGNQVLFEMRQKYRQRSDLLLLFAAYWCLGGDISGKVDGLVQSEMQHACEWETSMMLQIAPDLVGDYAAQAAVDSTLPFAPASRAWVTKDRSECGHIGNPQSATAEKGAALLQCFSEGVVELLGRMSRWNGENWEE